MNYILRWFEPASHGERSVIVSAASAADAIAQAPKANAAIRVRPVGVPCGQCGHLRLSADAEYGVRCQMGETSEQYGDFSCFQEVSRI